MKLQTILAAFFLLLSSCVTAFDPGSGSEEYSRDLLEGAARLAANNNYTASPAVSSNLILLMSAVCSLEDLGLSLTIEETDLADVQENGEISFNTNNRIGTVTFALHNRQQMFITTNITIHVQSINFPTAANLVLHLDAMMLSNGEVTNWPDLSGNGNHATGTLSVSNPSCMADLISGHQAVYFDGDDYLSCDDVQMHDNALGMTVFLVGDEDREGPDETFLSKNWWSSGQREWVLAVKEIQLQENGGVYSNAYAFEYTNSRSGPSVYALSWEPGGESALYVNGQQIASNTTVTLDMDDTTAPVMLGVANLPGSAGRFLHGAIGEVMIYRRHLSALERQEVERYLERKWHVY